VGGGFPLDGGGLGGGFSLPRQRKRDNRLVLGEFPRVGRFTQAVGGGGGVVLYDKAAGGTKDFVGGCWGFPLRKAEGVKRESL